MASRYQSPRGRGERMHHVGYAEVLRTIVDGGADWQVVAEKHRLGRQRAQEMLHAFADSYLCYEVAFRGAGTTRRSLTPVYAFGPGDNAPWPGKNPRTPRTPKPPKKELLAFITAVRALMQRPLHGKALSEAVGIPQGTAQRLLKRMHELRLIYVADFYRRRSGALGPPLYAFGIEQQDVLKPAPIPKLDLWRHHNEIRAGHRRRIRKLKAIASNASVFTYRPQATNRA